MLRIIKSALAAEGTSKTFWIIVYLVYTTFCMHMDLAMHSKGLYYTVIQYILSDLISDKDVLIRDQGPSFFLS